MTKRQKKDVERLHKIILEHANTNDRLSEIVGHVLNPAWESAQFEEAFILADGKMTRTGRRFSSASFEPQYEIPKYIPCQAITK